MRSNSAPEWLVEVLFYTPRWAAALVLLVTIGLAVMQLWLLSRVEKDAELVADSVESIGPSAFMGGVAVLSRTLAEAGWTVSFLAGVVGGGCIWLLLRRQILSGAKRAYRGMRSA